MNTEVTIDQELFQAILEHARIAHPLEAILLLRGKSKTGKIAVTDLILPPLATGGHRYSSFPVNMLPMDFSIMGSVHSHPSGSLLPSVNDLNHLFGKVMMIVAYPYVGEENAKVFSCSSGQTILRVV
ncbi:MAG: Mov34/MPN/PAD-1 family protein [Candidatus Bathyarchaeota archaeon]|nr:Mov34/MPN/PAD-1 family protein [Candidatus Bathyarchaeota archaeon]